MPLPPQGGRGLPFVMQGPMEKIPMTRAGFTALDEELKTLKSIERPAVIRAIAEAREHGDLSENAEYHAAREKQSFIEGRIKELEAMLSLADVIDPSKLSGAVKFGATITVVDEDTDEERTYQIVGETGGRYRTRPAEHPLAPGPCPDRQGRRRQRRGENPRRPEKL